MKNDTKKDGWDKFYVVTNFIAVVVIASIGGCINFTLKRRDTNVKMIEVAVGVLRSKPEEASGELRNWAMDVINQYSEVKITEKLREVLRTNQLPVSLPFSLQGEGGLIFGSSGPILGEGGAAVKSESEVEPKRQKP